MGRSNRGYKAHIDSYKQIITIFFGHREKFMMYNFTEHDNRVSIISLEKSNL